MIYDLDDTERILQEIVINELTAFSNGAKVKSPKLNMFIMYKVLINLFILIITLYISITYNLISFSIVSFIALICIIKCFNKHRLILYIMNKAKKRPDKKISTIISESCVRGEPIANGTNIFNMKPISPKEPLTITFSSVYKLVMFLGLAGFIYLFIPMTIYTRVDNGYAVAYARTGLNNSIKVSDSYNGKTVVGIKSGAYKNNIFLERIELPDDFKFIEGKSFMNCIALQEITIPIKVTELRGYTFRNCPKLKTITMHNNIIDIHAFCFINCRSLKSVILPEKITEIRKCTFKNCTSLDTIKIPDGVTRISVEAFKNCINLTEVEVSKDCDIHWDAFSGSPAKIKYK